MYSVIEILLPWTSSICLVISTIFVLPRVGYLISDCPCSRPGSYWSVVSLTLAHGSWSDIPDGDFESCLSHQGFRAFPKSPTSSNETSSIQTRPGPCRSTLHSI